MEEEEVGQWLQDCFPFDEDTLIEMRSLDLWPPPAVTTTWGSGIDEESLQQTAMAAAPTEAFIKPNNPPYQPLITAPFISSPPLPPPPSHPRPPPPPPATTTTTTTTATATTTTTSTTTQINHHHLLGKSVASSSGCSRYPSLTTAVIPPSIHKDGAIASANTVSIDPPDKRFIQSRFSFHNAAEKKDYVGDSLDSSGSKVLMKRLFSDGSQTSILQQEAPASGKLRKTDNIQSLEEGQSENIQAEEPTDFKQPPTQKTCLRKIRATKIHNLSERRRRDRINEKMRVLQELIPNSIKTDKASVLDEAIQYLKILQAQLQMMTMRNSIFVSPMMYNPSVPISQLNPVHPHLTVVQQDGLGTAHLGSSLAMPTFLHPQFQVPPQAFHPVNMEKYSPYLPNHQKLHHFHHHRLTK